MLNQAKGNQNEYKSDMNEIKTGRHKFKKYKKFYIQCAIQNIETLNKVQNKAIKSFNDYSSLLSDARHNPIYEKGFKILSPKQMLQ